MEVWISSSASVVWEYEISNITYNYGATGKGFTTRRLSTFRIDWVEDSASSSS